MGWRSLVWAGACAVEGGRVSWDCLDKKEDCQGRCGEGTARHAIFNGEQKEERVGFVLILNFEALPPVPPGSMESE